MSRAPIHTRPDDWLVSIFSARAVAQGGIIRRQSRDIDRIVGCDRFLRELSRRGYHAVENGGQIVIFCNQEAVRVLR
ncbi:hypothetical protein [Pseudoponticoccus marisrubri]|uniref:N-(5'-phosphoribosyl)anthranilate isomerase n=1 Tax=Pseudoponticoccus marisrubri TaxID=1685382 RepID=A0A0W7WP59_9RHOB|nr:hypothetical protein [Pseudoponticoccus marisrubri]KUF12367.1 hypothetical protein AVJ23_01140 [Pseudoponticoccus marisrubri]